MNKLYYIIAFMFLSITSINYAQYAPLKLGNVWVYEHSDGSRYRTEIIDSSVIIDSINYFGIAFAYQSSVSGFIRLREDSFYVSKEDSTLPQPMNEWKYYKKNAKLGDIWEIDYGHTFPVIYTITDTFPVYTFDTVVTGKVLHENFGLVEWFYLWAEEFGQLASFNWLGETQSYLTGCIINGSVYGDTTFIVSNVDDNTTISSYKLFQNYPNPFNNSTILTYEIPDGDLVLLEVYSSLGEKTDVLVNDFVPAGKHSVVFNAGKLTSGIYFYTFSSGNFIDTKKLILLK